MVKSTIIINYNVCMYYCNVIYCNSNGTIINYNVCICIIVIVLQYTNTACDNLEGTSYITLLQLYLVPLLKDSKPQHHRVRVRVSFSSSSFFIPWASRGCSDGNTSWRVVQRAGEAQVTIMAMTMQYIKSMLVAIFATFLLITQGYVAHGATSEDR